MTKAALKNGGVILFLLIACASVNAQEQASVIARATLDRPYDPVVIVGKNLPGFIEKARRPCGFYMRVMAWRNGAWEVIPFQVDEKKRYTHVGGWKHDLVYKDAPEYVTNEESPYTDIETCRFDEDDELVFMARDAGDRIPEQGWPTGFNKGQEIELAAGDAKAWVYLFTFENPPELSERRYVQYDRYSDTVTSDSYSVGYSRRDPLFFRNLSIPEKNGGTGENIVDGEKFRTRVRIFGGFMDYYLHNMDVYGKCFGVRVGPVRVIRRTDTKLEYYMFAGKYHKRDLFYYPFHFEYTLDESHHSGLRTNVYDLTFRITTDLLPDSRGMSITTSANPTGAVADGALSDEEKKMNYGPTGWVAVQGTKGRWIQQLAVPGSVGDKVWPDFYYLDDPEKKDPPERAPGQFGNAGFTVKHLQRVRKGVQLFRVAYYFPDKIDESTIANSLNVVQAPVSATLVREAINSRGTPGVIVPDTRSGDDAAEPSYVVHEEDIPTRGYFPQLMIDPNLGNGSGLGYVDRNFLGKGIDVDSFFILSDRLFFVGHIILNEWPFVPKEDDLKVWIEYQDHPNRFFFGIGNDTPESAQTIYHWKQFLAFVSYEHKLAGKFSAKGTIGFKTTEIGPGKWFSGKAKPTLQERFGFPEDITEERFGQTPFGVEGGSTNFVQLAFFRDGRDEWFNPHSGTYEEIRVDVVNPAIGADFAYVRIGLEAKGFWAPKALNSSDWYPNNPWVSKLFGTGKDVVIAARIAVDRMEAPKVDFEGRRVLDIPFFEQSYIGDSFNNRGYFWARYIDRDRLYLNVEYRSVLWKMWIIVFFYDTGRVFEDIMDDEEWRKTSASNYHHTFGIGLRGVFPAQLMMRMDVGFSAEHPGGIVYGNAYHTF